MRARHRTEPAPHPVTPALYPSTVTHVRTLPTPYTLGHRTFLWLVDLDRLPVLPHPLRPFARFDGRDHFAGRDRTIRAGLERFLGAHGVDLAGGRVLMLGNARALGHVFNPLTLYWCYGFDAQLRCVVAEVHNTYGERHAYLLPADSAESGEPAAPAHGSGSDSGARQDFTVDKEFYVSPFFAVDGTYRMRLPVPGEHLSLTVHLHQDGARPFTATVRGERRAATGRELARLLLRRPAPSLAVAAAIRRHGIRLWLHGLSVLPRPSSPRQKGMQ
ncbi:DUF1365 domain-containing protein [Streptomyces sp. TRM66268-LWL]|uniref:DUF1365 domain-containing protein n=1 Tax=Streptomyces polyasparticus TaxID=2767826 RepID=A0ABR7SEG1_9ACTN|nr:DUF1365 domain-containing protein [Streptomyces polyasparticus]MBC9712748.1 DUF1365 domain-containing protein [Streptomyces polyasparticus]